MECGGEAPVPQNCVTSSSFRDACLEWDMSEALVTVGGRSLSLK